MKSSDNRRLSPLERPDKIRRDILQAIKSSGRITFAALLEQTRLARSTLAKHLKELTGKGELLKEESVEDARVVYYSLSENGENSYLKGSVVSEIQNTNAQAGTVNKHEITQIPISPILESLLAEDEKGDPFLRTKRLLKRAIYEGLQRSASATVISERKFPPESIRLTGLADAYASVLGSLIENRMKDYHELEKRLLERFAKHLNAELPMKQVLATKEAEPSSSNAVERHIEKLTDDALNAEKERQECIRELFRFSFEIVVRYDGEQFSQVLDQHLKNSDIVRAEHREWIADQLKQALAKNH